MILPVDLPVWLKAVSAAAIAGLILGLGLGALSGRYLAESATVELGEPWTRRVVSVDTLLEVVDSSEHWRRGAAPVVEEPIPEEDIEVPGRPGIFKYLKLVAILREPELEAVFRPQKIPESMQHLMLLSPDDVGHIRVGLEALVAEGWVVTEITETSLEITGLESGEIVEYRLFEWN